jgi:beta-lactamase class C
MEQGIILHNWLPYLRQNGGDIRRVTLRQLATHTSSLPRSPDANRPAGGWNRQSVVQWLAQWRAPYPPGTKSLYSNLGVGLLGYAIAGYENRPLLEVWERQFLGLLETKHTFFTIPPDSAKLVAQGYGPKGLTVSRAPLGGWPAGG